MPTGARTSRVASGLLFIGAALLTGTAVALIGGMPTAHAVEAAGSPIAVKATELEPPPNPAMAYNRMAQAMGLFAQHGLVLELGPNLGGGGPARVQAIVTDNTELATSDVISVMGGVYSGAKIKILMVMTPYGDEEIWGWNKYKTMKDAEGLPWAVASLGGAERFNDQMAIEGMGLKPQDFQWIAIPGGDGPRLQAMESGRAQLATLSHVGAALAEAKGYTAKVHAIVTHTADYTPPIPRLVIVARADWIKGHEVAATRYVEMMLDAMRQWQDHSGAWVDPAEAIFKKSGLDRAQLQRVWREFRDGGYFAVNGGVNFAATQKLMDLFFQLRHESPNQYLSKPADLYDTGPLRTALGEMGVVKETTKLKDVPDWYHGSGLAAK